MRLNRTRFGRIAAAVQSQRHQLGIAGIILLVCSLPAGALADGCFVWHWDKRVDINEPTQKAILLYDAGREDLLLQVKYEGSLREFGWLIPVPSLPTVEKGSMEAFYELSQLTQHLFSNTSRGSEGLEPALSSAGSDRPAVKVLEIKTVGAYEVAVLSARDSGSLERWLKSHDYSLPAANATLINDYIRRGWCFVAARIDLNGPVGLKVASFADKSSRSAAASARSAVQRKLAKGELHPLRISFDTPTCVFPLKISALAGKPSEVSLYVLAEQPLLSPFLFAQASESLDQQAAKWAHEKPQRERARIQSWRIQQAMALDRQLRFSGPSGRYWLPTTSNDREWSGDDLIAAATEGMLPLPQADADEEFYVPSQDMLHSQSVRPAQLAQSSKSLPRLKNRAWWLTKYVRTFRPEEMQDLEFKPAISALTEALARPCGAVAAQTLADLGSNAIPALGAACMSTNPVVRANASGHLGQGHAESLFTPILGLLKDPLPQVRLRAISAADANWDARYAPALTALFHDPAREPRMEAWAVLAHREKPEKAPAYLELLKDPDKHVRLCALGVLTQLHPEAVPAKILLAMLQSSDAEQQAQAVRFLWQNHQESIARADLLPLLGGSFSDTVTLAMTIHLIEGTAYMRPPAMRAIDEETRLRNRLSSQEAASLLTNKAPVVRIAGLSLLRRNADAKALELLLPHLRESNRVVRSLAFTTVREITGKDLSKTDPGAWDQWWAANKATFVPPPRPAMDERGEFFHQNRPTR